MRQTPAKEVMSKPVITLSPEDGVKKAAKILADNSIGGAPVLDANGRLVGMISESDLIIQDIKLRYPTYIHLLDSFIFWGSQRKYEETLRRAAAAKVGELMSTEVVTASPEATLEDIATLMAEKQIGRVPIVEEEKLVGIITKGDVVRKLSR